MDDDVLDVALAELEALDSELKGESTWDISDLNISQDILVNANASLPSSSSSSSPPPTTTTTPPQQQQQVPVVDEEEDMTIEEDFVKIEDFSCASDWERLCARVEECLRTWQVTRNRTVLDTGLLQADATNLHLSENHAYVHHDVAYLRQTYRLELHYDPHARRNGSSSGSGGGGGGGGSTRTAARHAFANKTHHGDHGDDAFLTKWFGVRWYLVLAPAIPRRVSESECSFLLSTMAVACRSAACEAPYFVWTGDPKESQCRGSMYQPRPCLTTCNVEVLRNTPSNLRHLSGLSAFFSDQRRRGYDDAAMDHTKTMVAASFCYRRCSEDWEDVTDRRSERLAPWQANVMLNKRAVSDRHYFAGPRADPVYVVQLTTAWPYFPEDTYVDNAVYTELDPLTAPHWSVSAEWSRSNPWLDMPLTTATLKLIALAQEAGHSLQSLDEVLGAGRSSSSSLATASAASARAATTTSSTVKSSSSLSSSSTSGVVRAAAAAVNKGSKDGGGDEAGASLLVVQAVNQIQEWSEHLSLRASHGPMVHQGFIDYVMRALFDPSSSPSPSPSSSSSSSSPLPSLPTDDGDSNDQTYITPPSSRRNSFVPVPFGSFLSLFVSHVLSAYFDSTLSVRSVAILWKSCVRMLRQRWESATPLPHVAANTGRVDLDYCIVHQKLQLLQHCITVRRHQQSRLRNMPPSPSAASLMRQWNQVRAPSISSPINNNSNNASAWEELDFEWEDDSSSSSSDNGDDTGDSGGGGDKARRHQRDGKNNKNDDDDFKWPDDDDNDDDNDNDDNDNSNDEHQHKEPRGVSATVDSCIVSTGEPMRIPVVQEPPIMTEDMLDEQQRILEQLGTSREASRKRAELMGASLLSDMSAFKAANPGGCVFGDFVRWHSPNDWSDDTHSLSARMASEGNVWHRLWHMAKAVPADEQTPLFDHEVEAERVLDYLTTLPPAVLLDQMCKIAAYNALSVLQRCSAVREGVREVVNLVERAEREQQGLHVKQAADYTMLDAVVASMKKAELLCGRAHSLLARFPACYDLVNNVLLARHSRVLVAAERSAAERYFGKSQHDDDRLDDSAASSASGRRRYKLPNSDMVEFSLLSVTQVTNDEYGEQAMSVVNRLYSKWSDEELRLASMWSRPC